IGTRQSLGKKRIVVIGIHFGLKFERGIKIVQIIKLAQMSNKFQSYVLQAPVPMFCDYEFGLSRSRGTLLIVPLIDLIIFGPIDERNNIRILLNGTGLP